MDSSVSVNNVTDEDMSISDEDDQSENQQPNTSSFSHVNDADVHSQNEPSNLSNVSADMCVNDEDVITDVRVNSQNQRSSCLNNISDHVIDKEELKKILQTVLLLDKSKIRESSPVEIAELNNHEEPKIVTDCHMDGDSDEIELLDVIIPDLVTDRHMVGDNDEPELLDVIVPDLVTDRHMDGDNDEPELIDVIIPELDRASTKLSEMTAIDPSKNSSNTSENISDVHIQLEEAQNENSKPIPVNVEISPEKDPKGDSCVVPEIENAKSEDDCLPVKNLELNSETNTLTESHLNSNCSEKNNMENTIGTIDVKEHEVPCDSGMCVDMLDITDENSNDIEYDFNCTPIQLTGSFKEFNSGKKSNFTRGCKWAPDGSCILSCGDDNKLRVFNLPSQLLDSSQWSHMSEMDAVLRIAEGSVIYDYCWYPLMNSNDASTCCLVSTSKRNPVHMWDAYTGQLRCTYRSFNHLDELVTPHSLSFNSDGEKLFCGYQNVIRVFDVNRPGKTFEKRNIYANKTGQCGIISCFAFNPVINVSAAGSYMSSIGLYAEPYGELIWLLKGQTPGITQIEFSPDGQHLYSAARKDSKILCWDLRKLGTILFSMQRSSTTNQKLYFDISKCGKYVVSGNQDGIITFWDVTKEPIIINDNEHSVLVPTSFFFAHKDCANGVSFHPFYPLLCSSSGQRHFETLLDDDSEEMFSFNTNDQENSLRLWWLGGKSKK